VQQDVKEALSLASPVVNLRVTQVVNGVRDVHAILPHGAVECLARRGSGPGVGTARSPASLRIFSAGGRHP
jgi:hypothetical protein